MLSGTEKTKVITKHAVHVSDTGSPEVQIALFTQEIDRLAKHLKSHIKDNSSRRGLLKMVSKRRRMLEYLRKSDPTRYSSVTKDLGLKAK